LFLHYSLKKNYHLKEREKMKAAVCREYKKPLTIEEVILCDPNGK
jgi:Zn-dependent alcohol dehydrogenases, class III